MNTRIIGVIVVLLLLAACQSNSKEQLARDYYQALNNSNFERIAQFQFDSVRVKEGPYNSVYSINDYVNWLQWDSVFEPKYEILDVKTEGEAVELTVSKVCQRIQFLNGGPMVSKERLGFKEGKIYDLEIQEFIEFNGEQWNANREELVSWIDEHHPELNGFIYDQTLQGGLNYLKALELFKNKKDK